MKATLLIAILQKMVDKYGDLPVRDWREPFTDPEYIDKVRVFTEQGRLADLRRRTTDPVKEIILF